MSVLHIISFLRFEVGIEAPFLLSERKITFPRILVLTHTGTCGKLPFGLCGQTIRFDIHTFTSECATQEIGAPVAESISLLPADTYHRVIIISAMCEIHTHVRLVVSIVKIVYPCGGIGIDIYNVSVKEIIVAGKSAGYCFADYLTIVIDKSGIF